MPQKVCIFMRFPRHDFFTRVAGNSSLNCCLIHRQCECFVLRVLFSQASNPDDFRALTDTQETGTNFLWHLSILSSYYRLFQGNKSRRRFTPHFRFIGPGLDLSADSNNWVQIYLEGAIFVALFNR
jgi:hypothetical protein